MSDILDAVSVMKQAEREIISLREINAELVGALRQCKERLENDPAVTDTIWVGEITTLVDVIDAALAKAGVK